MSFCMGIVKGPVLSMVKGPKKTDEIGLMFNYLLFLENQI